MDSDDHNFNKKCDINDDVDDVLVEYKVDTKCCDKINGDESQYLDANGNPVNDPNQNNDCDECECSGVEIDPPIRNTIRESNEIQPNESSVVRNLMSMALSDYGESDLLHKTDEDSLLAKVDLKVHCGRGAFVSLYLLNFNGGKSLMEIVSK